MYRAVRCLISPGYVLFGQFIILTHSRPISTFWISVGRLNIKMTSYRCRDSHAKDESSYLGKTVFILRRGPEPLCSEAAWLVDPLHRRPVGCLNIKIVFPRYGDSHVKDKTVARPSYLLHGNPYTGKTMSLYWDERPPGVPLGSRGVFSRWHSNWDSFTNMD